VFAKKADKNGELEKGDIDEAFYGMSLGGDPEPEATGNVRYDAMIQARLARQSHGTKDQRTQNFRQGFNGGAGACMDEFKDLSS
jgi:predicted metalloprotease